MSVSSSTQVVAYAPLLLPSAQAANALYQGAKQCHRLYFALKQREVPLNMTEQLVLDQLGRSLRKYLCEAAELGHPLALYDASMTLRLRIGGERNLMQNREFLYQAVAKGVPDALVSQGLEWYNKELDRPDLADERTKKMARDCISAAARKGHPSALSALAQMLEFGQSGFGRDVERARKCYEAAIVSQVPSESRPLFPQKYQSADSFVALGTMYARGVDVPRDRAYALELCRRSGNTGMVEFLLRSPD
jgi:TPR repeat protein